MLWCCFLRGYWWNLLNTIFFITLLKYSLVVPSGMHLISQVQKYRLQQILLNIMPDSLTIKQAQYLSASYYRGTGWAAFKTQGSFSIAKYVHAAMNKHRQTIGIESQLNTVSSRIFLFQISLSLSGWEYGPLQRLTSLCSLQRVCTLFGGWPALAPPGL